MKRKFALLSACLLLMASLAACGSGNNETAAPGTTENTEAKTTAKASDETMDEGAAGDGQVFEVGIIQLVEHTALDATNRGFVDGLKEEGIQVNIDQQNAQNEQSTCDTIATKFVADNKDLIFAIATPAAQAVAGKTTDIPIVFSAVTDAESAELVESNDAPGGNVTGTSDLTPVKEQIELLTQLLPEAKTVGILYCSAEVNSVFQADLAKAEIEAAGLKWQEFTVSSSNEIQSVVESMVGKVDCAYAPTDNMIAAGMTTVAMVANENKLPVIVGEVGMLEAGGLATYSIDYYNLGKLAASQAAKILRGEAETVSMPVEYLSADECELLINEEVAKELGIEIPEELKEKQQ